MSGTARTSKTARTGESTRIGAPARRGETGTAIALFVAAAACAVQTIAPASLAAQDAPTTADVLNLPAARIAQRSLGVEKSERGSFAVRVVAEGLRTPWSIAFLANDEFLVSERSAGRLARINLWTNSVEYVDGLPEIQLGIDAGLLDVVLHPDYEENGWIYLSYTPVTEDGLHVLVVDRARLDASLTLVDRERLFEASAPSDSLTHHGGRVVLDDGYLYVTVGDRHEQESAQDLGDHRGSVIRLFDDGRVPPDNPLVGRAGVLPEIWSWGVRNPQGMARHPETGELWLHEHGPRGGDEVNIVRPGVNYGWPTITYGVADSGEIIGDGITRAEGLEQPVYFWLPSIAPSGLSFYTGDAFPEWRGSAFVGALAHRHLQRLVVDGDRVQHAEVLLAERRWRVRFASPAPDGTIYLGVDGGRDGGMLLRLVPPELEDM